jgi:hypothetical protein
MSGCCTQYLKWARRTNRKELVYVDWEEFAAIRAGKSDGPMKQPTDLGVSTPTGGGSLFLRNVDTRPVQKLFL